MLMAHLNLDFRLGQPVRRRDTYIIFSGPGRDKPLSHFLAIPTVERPGGKGREIIIKGIERQFTLNGKY